MAFSTQAALTVEVTRLLPIQTIANTTATALMKFIRNLHNSGSDIIVEEDLASIFGRSRISAQLESSFRTIVAKDSSIFITPDILLANGPGPTVARALQEQVYLRTVVQLSLLTWVYDNNRLAETIAAAIQSRLQSDVENSRWAPSQHGV